MVSELLKIRAWTELAPRSIAPNRFGHPWASPSGGQVIGEFDRTLKSPGGHAAEEIMTHTAVTSLNLRVRTSFSLAKNTALSSRDRSELELLLEGAEDTESKHLLEFALLYIAKAGDKQRLHWMLEDPVSRFQQLKAWQPEHKWVVLAMCFADGPDWSPRATSAHRSLGLSLLLW